jgi:subtilisin family serine protease
LDRWSDTTRISSVLFAGLWIIATLLGVPAGAVDPPDLTREAIRLPCAAKSIPSLRALAERLPSAQFKSSWVQYSLNWVQYSEPGILGRRLVFAVGDDELVIRFTGLIGSPDQVTARYDAGKQKRPLFLAIADSDCSIHTARRLYYDHAGRPESLQDLDGALRPLGAAEPLNPPVPSGVNPVGIPVGVVDSGVNYLLPEIAARLARDPDGEILGYDYWDLDPRPFDVSPIPDPFFPGHHGTLTSSLVLEDAPVAKLVPYRYPRPAMARMAALIEDAPARGVRLMSLSLGSTSREEWLPFQKAAEEHSEMLFVVGAGNHGRNIDDHPVHPAAFTLANMIVVTSATADGRLTYGVNWGPSSVDLLVTGEDVLALDFDGQRRAVSGSSYATARVTALAACLLAGHPDWSITQLKAAIFHEAQATEPGVVAQGFIPASVLGDRGACDPQQLAAGLRPSQAMRTHRRS